MKGLITFRKTWRFNPALCAALTDQISGMFCDVCRFTVGVATEKHSWSEVLVFRLASDSTNFDQMSVC